MEGKKRLMRSARLAAVGEIAAGVAHELNKPLTTITGFVELTLQELPESLPQREELQIVIDEAQRAQGEGSCLSIWLPTGNDQGEQND